MRARSAFRDRTDAGKALAQRLLGFRKREDCLVLAVPNGGIPVAHALARKLNLPLDVLLARRLRLPGNEGQVFGAVSADNGAFLDYALIRAAGITTEQIAATLETTRQELRLRAQVYRKDRKPLDVHGRAVILVDDGTAAGACLLAALHALRRMQPAQVVVAVPVCPAATCLLIEREADLLLAMRQPKDFQTARDLYVTLNGLQDEDVVPLLDGDVPKPARRPRKAKTTAATRGSDLPG